MTSPPQLPPFYRLHHLERIDSTNEEAKRLAAAGAPEGTLVWADAQSAGRGRRGRDWVSPRAISISRCCCGVLHANSGGAVGLRGVACRRRDLRERSAAEAAPRCKWPNDVLVGGRKIAGILLESRAGAIDRLEFIVIGIGINVASYPEGTEYPAISLAAAGAEVTAAALLPILGERLLAWHRSGAVLPVSRRCARRGSHKQSDSATKSACACPKGNCAAASPGSTNTATCCSTDRAA